MRTPDRSMKVRGSAMAKCCVMATSISAATALHAILEKVTVDENVSIVRSWEAALDAEIETAEFASRHAEVCVLVSDVAKYLYSLPEGDRERTRFTPYVERWHNAVCHRSTWSSNSAGNLIASGDLDMLSTLGMLRDQKRGESGFTENQLEQLRQSLMAWHELLEAGAFPTEVADEVRTSVAHLEWLLDRIEMFGSEPVERQGRNLLGLAFSTRSITPANMDWSAGLKKAVFGLMAVLAIGQGVTHQGREITENVAGMLDAGQTIVKDIDTPTEPPVLDRSDVDAVSEDDSSDE